MNDDTLSRDVQDLLQQLASLQDGSLPGWTYQSEQTAVDLCYDARDKARALLVRLNAKVSA